MKRSHAPERAALLTGCRAALALVVAIVLRPAAARAWTDGMALRDAFAARGIARSGVGPGPPNRYGQDPMGLAEAHFNEFMLPGDRGAMWLGPGQYDWTLPDSGVAWAQAHPGWAYQGEQLLYSVFVGQGNDLFVPGWLRHPDSATFYGTPTVSADTLSQYIHDLIDAYVGRYGANLTRLQIVNELASNPDRDFFYVSSSIGLAGGRSVAEYVDQVCRWAKAANPSVNLIINDYANEHDQDAGSHEAAFLSLARTLIAMGTPFDGLGFQCHEGTFLGFDGPVTTLDYELVKRTFATFAALGKELHVTEFDVGVPTDVNGVVTDADQALQAAKFQGLVTAFVEGGGALARSFHFWQIRDQVSGTWAPGGHLFDVSSRPKKGFYAVFGALDLVTGTAPPPAGAAPGVAAASSGPVTSGGCGSTGRPATLALVLVPIALLLRRARRQPLDVP